MDQCQELETDIQSKGPCVISGKNYGMADTLKVSKWVAWGMAGSCESMELGDAQLLRLQQALAQFGKPLRQAHIASLESFYRSTTVCGEVSQREPTQPGWDPLCVRNFPLEATQLKAGLAKNTPAEISGCPIGGLKRNHHKDNS